MICVYLVHYVYIVVALYYNLKYLDFRETLANQTIIFVEALYVAAFTIVFILHAATIQFKSSIPVLINHILIYFFNIQGKLL